MGDIINFFIGLIFVCIAVVILRNTYQAWLKFSNPAAYERMLDGRARASVAFYPYLVAGGVCMVFSPPLGLFIWLLGSLAATLAKYRG